MNEHVPEWSPAVDTMRPYLRLRRGTTWYIKRKSGNVRLSTDFDEAKILYDSELGKPIPENRAIRCEEAWEYFIDSHPLAQSTRNIYSNIWRNWARPVLGTKRVAEVQPKDVIRVLDRMRARGRKSDNGYRALSSFFTACTKEPTRYRFDSPVRSIGKQYVPLNTTGQVDETVVLDDETIEAMAGLAEVAGNPLRDDERIAAIQTAFVIRFQPLVGVRIRELLGARVSDVKEGRLHVERQQNPSFEALLPDTWFSNLKGRKGTIGNALRVVPLSEKAKEVFFEYVDRGVTEGWLQMGGLLLPTINGRPRAANHVITRISKVHTDIGTGVSGTHCFRHTAASRWLQNGATLEEVAHLLGNSPNVVRTRYGHLADLEAIDQRYARFL